MYSLIFATSFWTGYYSSELDQDNNNTMLVGTYTFRTSEAPNQLLHMRALQPLLLDPINDRLEGCDENDDTSLLLVDFVRSNGNRAEHDDDEEDRHSFTRLGVMHWPRSDNRRQPQRGE